MEINCAEFTKLTLNQISDLLLEKISETGNASSSALLMGVDQDGRRYNLRVSLELMNYE